MTSKRTNLNLRKYSKIRYKFKDSGKTRTIKEAYLSHLTSNQADKPYIPIQAFEAKVMEKLASGEILRAGD